ncbi:ABC transporter permease [Acidobacteriota bacterium]
MLITYFKLAYRNLVRNKLASFINITGLSVAIACSIVFFLLLDKEYTSDRFHENAGSIFMAVYTLEGDEQARRWGDSPLPLGPSLGAGFPHVERSVRVVDLTAAVRIENHVFTESIRFVDPVFLDMFTFPLNRGRKAALTERNSLILSRDTAEKYFGDEEPIGRNILITLGEKRQESYFVQGVAEKFPHNASFAFGMLTSLENLRDNGAVAFEDWTAYAQATFVQVKDPEDIGVVASGLEAFRKRHNSDNVDRPIASFTFEPLPTLSWESQEIARSISAGSTPQALILFFVIGLFLLIQACFNYVNIALGSSTRRLKEIGIRKVVGCQRGQLVRQFLGENVLMCFLALAAGLLITEFIFLPGLMGIMESAEKFTLLDFFGSSHFWLYLVLVLFLTGIGAGAYPALIITGLQPINIMRNKSRLGGKKRFTSALLAAQFGIAFVILCLVAAFLQNNRYQRQRDWGYNQEHVVNVLLESGEQFPILRNAAVLDPNVISAAGTVHSIGRSRDEAVIEVAAEKHEVVRFDVGLDYLETVGVRLKHGRFFRSDLSTDLDSAVVVNARFVREMGWEQAVDQTLRYDNRSFTVIGVVEDFHYQFFFEDIEPSFFRLAPEDSYRVLSARVSAGTGIRSTGALRKAWQELFPDSVFNAFFQDSVFESGHRNNLVITRIFSATAVITLLISCMGLFGLVTLMISKRMKELSIHKVLGASARQISALVTKRYVILLSAAMFLALPLSYFFLKALLDGVYRYHMPLGPLPFILACLVVLLTAFLTVAAQVRKAAVRDPIEALRYE